MSSSAYSSSDALDIGCFKRKLEQQLREPAAASELEDALFLAATLTNTDAARVACTAVLRSDCFRSLKADIQLSTEAVQQLMQTAVARSLDDVLSYAAAQPAAEQVPAAAMLAMITTALRNTLAAQNGNERAWAGQTLHVLCKAAALDDSAALALLETTAQLLQQCRQSPAVLDVVMSNAAVKGLGPDAVEQVMLQALQPNIQGDFAVGASPIVWSLTMLPGAQQLSAASLQRLLNAALQYGCGNTVSKLLRLPAVEQLSAAAVAGVLHLAVSKPNQAAELVVSDMVQPEIVPAAAELDSDTMVQLVQAAAAAAPESAAAQRQMHSSFRTLLRLPCLQQADAQQLRRVVLAAHKVYCGPVCASTMYVEWAMKWLMDAPAVHQLPADAVAALLALSMRYGVNSYVQLRAVIALSSTAGMTQQQLQPILLSVMQQLCKQAIDISSGRQKWTDSSSAADPVWNDAVKVFLLPAARQLDTAAVAALLAAAAEHTTVSEVSHHAAERLRQAVEHVCSLPGAQSIGGQQLAEMIRDITSSKQKRGSSVVVAALCQLPAAHELDSGVVGSFLLTAIQRQWLKAVPAVCSLPGASRLTTAEVQEVLWQVLRHWQKLRAEFVPLLTAGERGYLVRQEGWLLQAGEAVCGLAAAQQLGADAVEGLLQRVVEQRLHGLVPLLCGLAGAATISSAGVAALLRQTINWALDAQQQQLLQFVPERVCAAWRVHSSWMLLHWWRCYLMR
jgi:hypothetical protein